MCACRGARQLAWEAGSQAQRQQRCHAGAEAVARHDQLPSLREHSAAVTGCRYMCWVLEHNVSVMVQEHHVSGQEQLSVSTHHNRRSVSMHVSHAHLALEAHPHHSRRVLAARIAWQLRRRALVPADTQPTVRKYHHLPENNIPDACKPPDTTKAGEAATSSRLCSTQLRKPIPASVFAWHAQSRAMMWARPASAVKARAIL